MKRTLPDVLREAIRSANVTPSELAALAGIDKGIVSRFLRGQRTMTVDTAQRLLSAMGCSVTIKRRKKS